MDNAPPRRLAIIGAGELGRQLAHHARTCGFQIAGFLDDTMGIGPLPTGDVILGKVDLAETLFEQGAFDCLVIGIGYQHLRRRYALFVRLSAAIPFARLVHPSVVLDDTCQIGAGAVIYPGCVIDMGVSIGTNVLINVGCTIAHDSNIGSGSFMAPAVNVAGFATIGERVFLGIGCIVIDHVSIASDVRTGAGAVVVDDILVPGLYLGMPARLKAEQSSP